MGGGIDPRIALSGQVPQFEGPIDLQKGALSVQQLINATQLQKQQQQMMQTQQQQQEIELQQQQQAQKDQIAFNKSYMDAGGDWDKAIQNATTNGVSGTYLLKAQAARADQLSKLATMNKEQLANESTKNDNLAKDALALKNIDDPAEREAQYQTIRNGHIASGAYKSSDLPPTAPNDQQLDALIAHSKAAQDMLKEAGELQKQNAELPAQQAEANAKRAASAAQLMNGVGNQIAWTARRNFVAKSDPEMAANIPENFSPEAVEQVRQMGISPEKATSIPLDRQAYQQWAANPANAGKTIQDFQLEQDVKKQKALLPGEIQKVAAEGAARGNAEIALLSKLQSSSQQGGKTIAPGMSQDTTDQAATTYHNTGTLPAVGRGQAGVAQRTAIMNREREMFPNTVLSADSAEFKSNAASLKNVQKQFDQVNAFENTAIKNLDLFTGLAKKAIDTGIPLLNAPLRNIAAGLGSEDQAALNAARQVAINEVAKVTSNPGLSGQLSDSARHEVEAFNPANATYGQMIRVAGLLKQDMANRHDSYLQQIADIQAKLRGAQGVSGNTGGAFKVPSGAPAAPQEDGHKLKANGQVIAVSKGGSWVAP